MLNSQDPTLLDKILNTDKEHFRANINSVFKNIESHITDGNVVYRLPFKRASIQTLLSNNTSFCVTDETIEENYSSSIQDDYGCTAIPNLAGTNLLSSVTDKFINIQAEAPFTDCIKTIKNFYDHAGPHFYGALLRDVDNPDVIINPLHVLTALSVVESEEYLHKRRFNILVYTYSNRSDADYHFGTYMADKNLIEANLNALMHTYTSKYTARTIVVNTNVRPNGQDIRIRYKETGHVDDKPGYIHHIVAHQLLTSGIIAPYYGASLIEWSSDRRSCTGIHLTPMRSCNVNGHHFVAAEHQSQNHSVCTGNISNTSAKGLQTLTHAYLGSPHQSSMVGPGALAYADAMIEKSMLLYTQAGLLEQPQTKEPEFSEAELNCETLADFVALNKTDVRTIPLAELNKKWKQIKEYKASLQASEPAEPVILTQQNLELVEGSTVHFSYGTNKKPDEWPSNNLGTILSVQNDYFVFDNGNTKRKVKIHNIAQMIVIDKGQNNG